MNTIYAANLCCSIDHKSTTRIVTVEAMPDGCTFRVHVTGNTLDSTNYPPCICPFLPSPVEYSNRRDALASAQNQVDSLLKQKFVHCEDADPTMKQWRMDNVESARRWDLLETRKDQTSDPAVKWELTQQQHPYTKQIAETGEKIKRRKVALGFVGVFRDML